MYEEGLSSINFGSRWMQEDFSRLLGQYEFLSAQIAKQTQLLRWFHIPVSLVRVQSGAPVILLNLA